MFHDCLSKGQPRHSTHNFCVRWQGIVYVGVKVGLALSRMEELACLLGWFGSLVTADNIQYITELQLGGGGGGGVCTYSVPSLPA